MTVKTLTGPGGLTVVLDSREIFPDDPGQGTPAMVNLDSRKASATFNCAWNEGTLSRDDGGEVPLTISQSRWLDEIGDEVDAFIAEHTPKP